NRAGDHLREQQAADADRRALNPSQPRRRCEHGAIDVRHEGHINIDDQPADAFLVPGVDEGVLGKVAAELVDEGGRDDPRRGVADHADENLHRTYVDLPPRLNTRRTSPITIDRSTAFSMS